MSFYESMMKLPELPPRHKWEVSKSEINLMALNTVWCGRAPEESVMWGSVQDYKKGLWQVYLWKQETWALYQTGCTKEEALSVMAAAVWLGLPEYKFREDEDEQTDSIQA